MKAMKVKKEHIELIKATLQNKKASPAARASAHNLGIFIVKNAYQSIYSSNVIPLLRRPQ